MKYHFASNKYLFLCKTKTFHVFHYTAVWCKDFASAQPFGCAVSHTQSLIMGQCAVRVMCMTSHLRRVLIFFAADQTSVEYWVIVIEQWSYE